MFTVWQYGLWSFQTGDTKLERKPVIFVVSWLNFTLKNWRHTGIAINLKDLVWQYGLWSFQAGGTKLERFLPKNQHTQRKLLNFEFWINGELSKSAKI
jgi:putative NADPH-quinone reductase